VSANLEFVRGLYENEDLFELGKRGDAPIELVYTPDAVVDIGAFEAPGLQATYSGLAEVRRFWADWFGAWESIRWRAEFHEREPWVLADVFEFVATGAASGIEVEMPNAQTFLFRDGRVERHKLHRDREAAFVEAGIELPPP
jgi:ketosteroid isomerase-like protein